MHRYIHPQANIKASNY